MCSESWKDIVKMGTRTKGNVWEAAEKDTWIKYGWDSYQSLVYNDVENRGKKKTVSNDLEDMTKISGQIVESASWLLLATLNKIQEDKNGLKTILFNFFFSGI